MCSKTFRRYLKMFFPLVFLLTTGQKCATFGGSEKPALQAPSRPGPEAPGYQRDENDPRPDYPQRIRRVKPREESTNAKAEELGDVPEGSFRCLKKDHTTDWNCLMCACYHEGRSQGEEERLWIGKSVITRVGMSNYPDSICGVITHRKSLNVAHQYSYLNGSAYNKEGKRIKPRALTIDSKGDNGLPGNRNNNRYDMVLGYKRCYKTTKALLSLPKRHYVSHYHKKNMKVYPHWTRNCSRVNNGRRGVIGSHVFYESCKGYPRAYPNLEIDGEEEEAATAMYKNDQLNDELLAIVDKINGKAEKEPKGLLEKMNQSLKEIYQYVFS